MKRTVALLAVSVGFLAPLTWAQTSAVTGAPAEVRKDTTRAMSQWAVSTEKTPLFVAVSDSGDRPSLLIFRRGAHAWAKVATLVVGDPLLNVFVTSEEDGYLVTEWAGGSGIVVRVFEWEPTQKSVRQVLETGAKGLPDVIRTGRDHFDVALIFRADEQGVAARGGASDRAVIYKLAKGRPVAKSFSEWRARYSALFPNPK